MHCVSVLRQAFVRHGVVVGSTPSSLVRSSLSTCGTVVALTFSQRLLYGGGRERGQQAQRDGALLGKGANRGSSSNHEGDDGGTRGSGEDNSLRTGVATSPPSPPPPPPLPSFRHARKTENAKSIDEFSDAEALECAKVDIFRLEHEWEALEAERELLQQNAPRNDAQDSLTSTTQLHSRGVKSSSASSTHSMENHANGVHCNTNIGNDSGGMRDSQSTLLASTAPGSGGSQGDNDTPEWPEPTLEDLDRSIPQVDCAFVANLIRSRNIRRGEFLDKKAQVKQKVEALTQKDTRSVADAARLPRMGGLGFWRRGEDGNNNGEEFSIAATSVQAPIVASPHVLAQLSDDETDALNTMRPEYDDGFILLDCRTVNEVTSWGIIEGAKVLPAHELFDAFHATPEDFLSEYGFPKPRPDDVIICYCQYGPRSLMATQILSWMGYLKVLHFRDGYYEWGKQYNILLRRWMEHDKTSGNELRRLATFQAGLELQREIAPEFNTLTMGEAAKYRFDTTRSPGKLLVGEGLRLEVYEAVRRLTEGLAPPELSGVLDWPPPAGALSEGNSAAMRREQHLRDFMEQATGVDPHSAEMSKVGSMGLGEAHAKVMDTLDANTSGDPTLPPVDKFIKREEVYGAGRK